MQHKQILHVHADTQYEADTQYNTAAEGLQAAALVYEPAKMVV